MGQHEVSATQQLGVRTCLRISLDATEQRTAAHPCRLRAALCHTGPRLPSCRMEFPFSLRDLLSAGGSNSPHTAHDVSFTDSAGETHTLSLWTWSRIESHVHRDRTLHEQWVRVVDQMGSASATAQALKAVITSATKFTHSHDRIYLHTTAPNRVNGLLRTGSKKLFIRDELASIAEITPTCVLDFFVVESMQRQGVGKQLFEYMLGIEGCPPARFGYDRPSSKLLAFLGKHYALRNFVPQNNNFVVFRKYFAADPTQKDKHDRLQEKPSAGLSPKRAAAAAAAGMRGATHSSSTTISKRSPFASEMVPSPRGVGSPVGHLHQQGGPVSRQQAPPPGQRRTDYSSYAALQQSPPVGQAAFNFDSGDARQLRFDEQQDRGDRERGGQPQPRESRRYNAAATQPASSYPSSSSADPQRFQQQSNAPYASPSRDPRDARNGAAVSASPTSSSFHSIFPTQNTAHDDPHHPLSNYRRSTPPEGASRLARAGSNVLSTSNLRDPQGYSAAAPAAAANPYPSRSPARGAPPPASYLAQTSVPLRLTQYHQHNIITGYQSGAPGSSPQQPQQRNGSSSQQPANFLPDGFTPPSTELGSDPSRGRVARSGVAARPLADPGTTYGVRLMDESIAARERSIAAKEALIASAPKFAIPYRRPDARDATWSKSASYQRITYGLDQPAAAGYEQSGAPESDAAILATAPGGGGGATSGQALTGRSEKSAAYPDPYRSSLQGGGAAQYGEVGKPEAVYSMGGVGQRQMAPFAYGARRQ